MKTKLPIVIILSLSMVCAILLQAVSWGAIYYADFENGDDSLGDGSKGNPWRTVSKAKSTVSAGDTVNLLPGSYGAVTFGEVGDSYGTASDYITYQSYPDPYGAKFTSILFDGAHDFYITISGIDVTCPDGSSYGIKTYNASFVRILDCKVHGPWGGGGAINPSLVHIRASNNILVEGCEVYNAGDGGIAIWGSENITVRGCHVHDITGSGIATGGILGTGNYVLEYNNVHTNQLYWKDSDPTHRGGSGFSLRSDNTTIRGNIIHGVWGTRPIRVYPRTLPDWSSDPRGWSDLIIENNLVYQESTIPDDKKRWAEFLDLNENIVIRHNTFGTFVNMAFAQNADGTGLSIYNNVFVGNLELDDFDATSSGPGRTKWDNVNEGNNIFGGLRAKGCGWMCFYDSFSATSKSVVATLENGYPSDYFTSGFFVDIASQDYRLAANSPAIGFANPAYAPATDLLGNPRDAAPDAGCYEYVGAPILDHIGDKFVGENETLTFDVNATDPDSDTITYSVQNKPTTATFIGQTFTWTPTHSEAGEHQVKFIVSDGQYQDSETITIAVLKADKEFGKLTIGCYNNVFNPTKGERALIVVELQKQAHIRLDLYNTRGNRIKEIADEEREADTYWYYWDGRNDSGNVVGSGLYFVHIQAGDYKKTKKIVVVK